MIDLFTEFRITSFSKDTLRASAAAEVESIARAKDHEYRAALGVLREQRAAHEVKRPRTRTYEHEEEGEDDADAASTSPTGGGGDVGGEQEESKGSAREGSAIVANDEVSHVVQGRGREGGIVSVAGKKIITRLPSFVVLFQFWCISTGLREGRHSSTPASLS